MAVKIFQIHIWRSNKKKLVGDENLEEKGKKGKEKVYVGKNKFKKKTYVGNNKWKSQYHMHKILPHGPTPCKLNKCISMCS